MKAQLIDSITQTLIDLHQSGQLPIDVLANGVSVQLVRTRDKQFGDFSCNIAMLSAKLLKQKPRDIAEHIVSHLPKLAGVKKVDVAGAGFINFYLADDVNTNIIATILAEKQHYGESDYGKCQRVHLEYVSANPTGPLHVGHGRGAAYGATLANILSAAGYCVHREYYVNDAGRQMDILAVSIWCRYLQRCGKDMPLPCNAYQGDYVNVIASTLFDDIGAAFTCDITDLISALPKDSEQTKEAYIDALIDYAKQTLGAENYRKLHQLGVNTLQQDIHDDLAAFGVVFDNWFSERSLTDNGCVDAGIQQLKDKGYTYERDGVLWFNAMALGDDKDRVLIRDNGQTTYFASDVAYQADKYNRGFDKIINIFGADHHGYAPRLRAFLSAIGKQPDESFFVSFVQFAILWRGKEKVSMSTRSGQYVTLRQLRDEVGNDAARFFYVMRKHEQHMDFDLELAKSQSNDNPVYYIQYAHARICSVERQLIEKSLKQDAKNGLNQLTLLVEGHEKQLMTLLARFPEIIIQGAKTLEVHGIAHYLRELAGAFHAYYNSQQFIVEDKNTRDARLCLVKATQIVLQNGLRLLGVSAPEKM